MKKIIALLIAFVMVFSLAGCSKKNNRDKNTIYLDFEIVDNGYGYAWLFDACEEFEEVVKDKDYGGGKKPGVVCKVKPVESATDLQTMKRSGVEGFFSGGRASSLILQGAHMLDITDVMLEKNYNSGKSIEEIIQTSDYDQVTKTDVNGTYVYSHSKQGTSIADLLYPEAASLNKVVDAKGNETYYTIPTHEIYSGMTYDKDLFDEYGFYFANPDNTADAESFYSDVTKSNADFIFPGDDANKSVGPDGKTGVINGIDYSYDDGMPSSLVQLIQLFEYMKYNNVYPMQVPGSLLYEADFFVDGLYAALLGAERARGSYDFNSEFDIITRLITTQSAFQNESGVSYLTDFYKPDVVTKTITEETGYYSTWSVERYYALMFLDICNRQGWFAPGDDPDVGSYNHQQAQYQFICSNYDNGSGSQGPLVGTMSTGSYWYNESYNSFTNFSDFYRINTEVEHRNLLWMPMPVNIFTPVTGETGEESVVTTCIGTKESKTGEVQVIEQAHANCIFFNANVASDPQTHAALKDWIRFFNSYEQLEKNTIRQGFKKSLNYKVRELEEITNLEEREAMKQLMIDSAWMDWDDQGNAWEGFYKQLADYADDSFILRLDAQNATYNTLSGGKGPFKRGEYSKVCTGDDGNAYLKNLKKNSKVNAMTTFEYTMISYSQWTGYYKGSSVAGKLQHEGQDINYYSYQGTLV